MTSTHTHKTVLLRERKRHTAGREASTRSTVLSFGVGRGYLCPGGRGTPVPSRLVGGGGYPSLVLAGEGYPSPCPGLGVPPPATGVPTWRWGTSSRKDIGPVEVLWDEDGVHLPQVVHKVMVKIHMYTHTKWLNAA